MTRRVVRLRSEQRAARRRQPEAAAHWLRRGPAHPSTRLPPVADRRSDALSIEMSVLEARPLDAPPQERERETRALADFARMLVFFCLQQQPEG